MIRRFITPDEIKYEHHDVDLKHCELRQRSIIDEFYQKKVMNEDGTESVSFVDPIYVLFNQERLNQLGSTGAQAFLDSLQPQSDSLAELRKKCSDDDLMKMMKSRYLQSPAEILAWCRYMENNVNEFNAEVQKLVEAQSQQQQTESSVESPKTE